MRVRTTVEDMFDLKVCKVFRNITRKNNGTKRNALRGLDLD